MANSLFETIAKAQVLGGGTYLAPNQEGEITVAQCGIKSGYKGQSAIFKFVIERARPLVAGGQVQEPGTRVTTVQNLSKAGVAGDMARANTLTIVAKALGVNVDEHREELAKDLEKVFDSSQMLRGFRLRFSTPPNKKDPAKFFPIFESVHSDENKAEVIKARREALDKTCPIENM